MSKFQVGQKVQVNQGFGEFDVGRIVSEFPGKNQLGNRDNYVVDVVEVCSSLGRVGVRVIQASNLSATV